MYLEIIIDGTTYIGADKEWSDDIEFAADRFRRFVDGEIASGHTISVPLKNGSVLILGKEKLANVIFIAHASVH